MKKFRFGAVAVVAAAGLVATLGAATPAAAADSYVLDSDLGVEGATYPDGWFVGNPAPPVAPVSTEDGLELTGRIQLFHGGVIEDADLSELVVSASVEAEGTWTFHIPVFLNSDSTVPSELGFTTFRVSGPGSVSTEDQWVSSQSVGGLTKNVAYSFAEIEEAFESGSDPVVLAYGVYVDPGLTATIQSISWDGDTSYFTPEPPVSFNDIEGNAFSSEIEWLAAQGITTGYANADGSFSYRPAQPVLREQMAAFLYRYANGGNPAATDPTSTFADVPAGHVFNRHIAWLAAEGITQGYVDNTFRGGQPVLREQMAAFLYRLADEPDVDTSGPSPFTDVPKTHTFYKQIVWLESTGITEGYIDSTFRGSEPVLREQMAAFLFRFDGQGVANG